MQEDEDFSFVDQKVQKLIKPLEKNSVHVLSSYVRNTWGIKKRMNRNQLIQLIKTKEWQEYMSKDDYVRGPISMFHMTNDKQSIYLFGDRHERLESDCYCKKDITNFLTQWFASVPYKTDFVLETWNGIFTEDDDEEEHYLRDLKIKFNDVFHLKKKRYNSMFYPETRFHMNDWRLDEDNINHAPPSINFEKCKQYWRLMCKVDKELKHCSEYQVTYFEQYIEEETKDLYESFVQQSDKTDEDEFNLQAYYGMIYMDVYTIARIVRTWKDDASMFRNVVIYTGDFHTQAYLTMLTQLGFEMVTASEAYVPQVSAEAKCIDTKECPTDYACKDETCQKEPICKKTGKDGKIQCLDLRRFLPLQIIPT